MLNRTILAQEVYYLCSKHTAIMAAKELIHIADTVISTFRFSNLYIKNLLFARQTKMGFYFIYRSTKPISNTL